MAKAAVERPPLWRALGAPLVLTAMLLAGLAGARPAHTALGPVELALYSAAGAGPSRASSQTVPQSAAPTALVNLSNVTVSWATTTLSGGTPAPGYVVRRYTAGGSPVSIQAACTGTITSTSCVESGVADGQWRYSVQAVATGWSGPESPLSAIVTVAVPHLVITNPTITGSLPAVLTGTISNFIAGQALSFHLDSATGPVLTGSPATVPAGGAGAISVTIPAGTNDAPHSVFAVGGASTVASAAIDIVDPPHLLSLQMFDIDGDGKVDQVKATFDDTLAAYTAGTAPWTLANVPSGGTLQSVSVTGAVATLTLTEGAGAATTAAGSFTIALAANSAGIRDIYNHPSSFAATAVTDKAAPAVISMSMTDTNANGKVDHVSLTFSEAMAAYTAGNTPWTLANVPSGGSLNSVAVASPSVTLTLNEGAGALDTGVGSFTVALATSATGIRDAAGNLSSFTARAPSDGAVPVRTGMDMLDVDKDGWVDATTVTFSEPLAAYSAGTTPWTLTNVPSGGTLGSVSVGGAVATLDITPGAGAASTAVGSYRVALATNAAGIRDAAGNQASFAATAPADKAAPAPLSLVLQDTDTDGRVDHVAITWSETIAAYTAGNAPWTLAGVPSGGTLNSVSASGTTTTLTLNEGAGAVDTSAGSMTVALAASTTGIRDAAGNLTSFAARPLADGAIPLVTSITDTDGGTNGHIESGDTLVVSFSEALDPTTVPTSVTLTLGDPQGNGSDYLDIPGITEGPRSTGSNSYMLFNQLTATFASSTVALSNGNKTITVTVGPSCSGIGCFLIGTVTNTPNLSWLTASTITDPAGNVPTQTFTQAIRLF
jgi:hypothetical protein